MESKLNPHAPLFRPSYRSPSLSVPCLGLLPPSSTQALYHLPPLLAEPYSFHEFPLPPPLPAFCSQTGVDYCFPSQVHAPHRIIENLYFYLSPLCVPSAFSAASDSGCKAVGRLPTVNSLPPPLTPTTVLDSAPIESFPFEKTVKNEPTEGAHGIEGEVTSEGEHKLPKENPRRPRVGIAPQQQRVTVIARCWKPKRREIVAEARRTVGDGMEFTLADAGSVGKTTVMIRNIPNRFREMLVEKLGRHCLVMNNRIRSDNSSTSGKEKMMEAFSEFDFVYLPMDFRNKCNLGYAFVNFTTAVATSRLYRALHSQRWRCFGSKKTCEIWYARIQGKEALKSHFRSSNFTCDSSEYLPVEFSPPHDGSSASVGTTIGRLRPPQLQDCNF